jgi:hypothetical protein
MIEQLIKISVCLFVLWVLWKVARPKWDIHISVRDGAVKNHRGIAIGRTEAIRQFFVQDLKLSRIEVRARRDRNGRFITDIRGKIDSGTKQRIRNYLLSM